MNSYLLKVFVIFVIAAVGAGVQLGAAWPVQLKAAPDEPPPIVLNLPSGDDAAADNTQADESADEPVASTEEALVSAPAPSGQTITLDGLEIDLATARALFENNLATFVDARVAGEFEAGHIDGALSISPAALEANASLFALDVIDPAKPIVIYCGGGDCDDSHRVAEMLQDLRGFKQTHVFVDGFPAWEAAGLPTGSGPDPFAE